MRVHEHKISVMVLQGNFLAVKHEISYLINLVVSASILVALRDVQEMDY